MAQPHTAKRVRFSPATPAAVVPTSPARTYTARDSPAASLHSSRSRAMHSPPPAPSPTNATPGAKRVPFSLAARLVPQPVAPLRSRLQPPPPGPTLSERIAHGPPSSGSTAPTPSARSSVLAPLPPVSPVSARVPRVSSPATPTASLGVSAPVAPSPAPLELEDRSSPAPVPDTVSPFWDPAALPISLSSDDEYEDVGEPASDSSDEVILLSGPPTPRGPPSAAGSSDGDDEATPAASLLVGGTAGKVITLRGAQPAPPVPGPPFSCPRCSKSCQSRAGYLSHYQKHLDPLVECSNCGKKGWHTGSMIRHCRTCFRQSLPPDGDEPGPAEGEAQTGALIDEQIISLGPPRPAPRTRGPPFECPHDGCTRTLQTKEGFRLHWQTHGAPLFECRVCGKTTHQRGQMRDHIWSHTISPAGQRTRPALSSQLWFDGDAPFKCPQCPQEFATRATAYAHLRTHYAPDCKCEWCDFMDHSPRAIRQHARTCPRRPGASSAGPGPTSMASLASPRDRFPDSPPRPPAPTARQPSPEPPSIAPPREPSAPPAPEWWSSHLDPVMWDAEDARRELDALARAAGLQPPDAPVPARPNTTPPFPVFDPAGSPATTSRLRPEAWAHALQGYPDPAFVHNILGMIKHGAKLGYDGPLRGSDRPVPRNHNMSGEALTAVRTSVREACAKGFTRLKRPGEVSAQSPVGAVPKKPSGWRMINDLSWPRTQDRVPSSSVNEGVQLPERWLSYQSIDGLLDDLTVDFDADTWLWKMDLKDAYRHVVVDAADAALLGFHLDGKDYVDCCLNFGGKSSPFIFNMFSEALAWILASFGLRNRHLLDDFFGRCKAARGPAILRFLDALCGYLGLSVARHKSLTGPCVEILGIMVDGPTASAWLSPDKLEKLRWSVRSALSRESNDQISFSAAESLVSSLTDATRIVAAGRAFTRGFYDWLTDNRHRGHRATLRLSRDLKSDLRWWNNLLRKWPGVRLLRRPRGSIEIWTDAATSSGLGGHLGPPEAVTARFSAPVPDHLRGANIMALEAEAVHEALQRWAPAHKGFRVVCRVDNQAVVNALLTGRIRHRDTQRVVRRIFTLLHEHRIFLRVSWIASEDNAVADALSRQVLAPVDIRGL